MQSFQSSFQNYRKTRRGGLLLVALGIGISLLLFGGILLGVLDFGLALPSEVRIALGLLLVIIAAAALITFMVRARRESAIDAASYLDEQTSSSRRLVTSAASLRDQEPTTPLQAFLQNRLELEAQAEIAQVKTDRQLPLKELKKVALATVGILGLLMLLFLIKPKAVSTVFSRLVFPTADIAPYTSLDFALTPESPQVTYGDTITIEAAITGDDIHDAVECLVRKDQNSEERALATLRDGQGRYVRTFREVVAPFEVAFQTGKARSAWQRVDVLLQPLILKVHAETTPPDYTKIEPLQWELKGTELTALEGSLVKLQISSNRPLSRGVLTITQDDGRSQSASTTIIGSPSPEDDKTCVFQWEATHSGTLVAEIKDILGTPCASPLKLTFISQSDAPPNVQIGSPSIYVQATPDAKLNLEGYAEDDYGLSDVKLVRTMVGLRDRSSKLASEINDKDFDYKQPLELSQLGLDPGNKLEFYLEAQDHNPNLMGVTTSDIITVDIISHEDYAERLRYETTLEQFAARYEAVQAEMEKVRDSLKKLEEVSKKGSIEEFQEALAESEKAHQSAKELLSKIAEDFQAFDHEGALKEAAQEVSQALDQNIQSIQSFSPEMTRGQYEQIIRAMQANTGTPMDKMDEVLGEAELLKKSGEVMQKAAEFKRLTESQRSLAERLHTIAKEVYLGNTNNTAQLKPLADTQEKNREALEKLITELKEILKDFPEELEEVKQGTQVFLDKYDQVDIPSVMNRTSSSAREGQSSEARKNAILAYELMQQLIEEGDCFGEMCKGQTPGACSGGACKGLGSTMSQLLQSLLANEMGKLGNGPGNGEGGGGSGGGPSGYAAMGNQRQIPTYGPDRLSFNQQVKSSSGKGGETGGTPEAKPASIAEANTISPEELRNSDSLKTSEYKVPDKYRDALKIYFTPND